MCEYMFRTGKRCKEENFQDSKYCILHMDFPKNEKSEDYKRIKRLKEAKVKEKICKEDFNFEGAKLVEIYLPNNVRIKGFLNFQDAVIEKGVRFVGAKIDRDVLFEGAHIGEDVFFVGAKINGGVRFNKAEIGEEIVFEGAEINEYILFTEVKINGDIALDNAKIDGIADFYLTEIKGELKCKYTKFRSFQSQEVTCRKAKKIYEELGNREESDYYFYREMEARRKQKKWFIRYPEILVQYIFGYGTAWGRVLFTWFVVVFGLAFWFWRGKGVVETDSLWENIYFSIVTATTLGYGDCHPTPGFFQGLASFEAIFGSFMWAVFVVIFARKFMRR